jgi:hypothetical protein
LVVLHFLSNVGVLRYAGIGRIEEAGGYGEEEQTALELAANEDKKNNSHLGFLLLERFTASWRFWISGG